MRTIVRRLPVVLGLLAACRRDRPARPGDSTATAPPAGDSVATAVAPPLVSGWDRAAGTALVVQGDGGEALVVAPGAPGDSATDRTAGSAATVLPGDVALFTRAGSAGRASATAVDGGRDCEWPTARLGPASGADAMPSWTVGFVGSTPVPLALDSITGASRGDSATFAATVTGLATSLRDDTVRALRGVPYTVRWAARFTVADGTRDGLVAVLTRSLNQEASPINEQLMLVAERPHAGTGAATNWTVAYHERHAGREEDVPATEVLSAVTLDQRPTLVLGRALANGTRYSLLERLGDGTWRLRWTSAVRGC